MIDRSTESGTSLIEVMIATLTCLVLVGAVLTIVTQQGRHRQVVAERSLALSAVVNNLERVRTLSDAEIAALDGVGFDIPGANGDPGGLEPRTGDSDGLPGEFVVTEDQNVGGEVLHRVVAIVRWRGVSGNSQLALQTLVTERR